VLPIAQAMQLLATAGYVPLGPLIEQHEFPLLVKKQQVVSVAKIARPDNVAVLQQLAQHPVPRMPRIEDVLTAKDCTVSVETLINGETLSDRLQDLGLFTTAMVAQVATELLSTLQHLATLNIVHRDIKLSNIMFYKDHYYLIDVNAAREYHAEQSSDTRLLGTSGFAAPENYGFAQTDQRSDIYALGVVLNCLLTGQIPGGQAEMPPITDIQPWAKIITRATALDPDQRYQNATEMLAALSTSVSPDNVSESPYFIVRWWSKIYHPVLWTLWIVYGIFCAAAFIIGLDKPSIIARFGYWLYSFIMLGAPVLSHLFNRWASQHWPEYQWYRYRWWLRISEGLIIFILLGTLNPYSS